MQINEWGKDDKISQETGIIQRRDNGDKKEGCHREDENWSDSGYVSKINVFADGLSVGCKRKGR